MDFRLMNYANCVNVFHVYAGSVGVGVMSLKESVTEKLSRERHELVNIIESRYELLAELLSARVLNEEQLAELQETNNLFKRNKTLLGELSRKTESERDLKSLIDCLKRTGQTHVACFLWAQAETGTLPTGE